MFEHTTLFAPADGGWLAWAQDDLRHLQPAVLVQRILALGAAGAAGHVLLGGHGADRGAARALAHAAEQGLAYVHVAQPHECHDLSFNTLHFALPCGASPLLNAA